MKKLFCFLLSLAFLLASCNKDESNPSKELQMPDFNVIDVSESTSWDYMVTGREDYYLIKTNETNTFPKSVLYHSESINENFSIFFKETGKIDKVVFKEHIFIFRNFRSNFVDIGIVYPNGSTETLKRVETPSYNWDTHTLTNKKIKDENELKRELIRWTGHTIAGIPCALSIAAAIPTGGLSLLGGVTCGTFAFRLLGDVLETDFNIHNNINEFVEQYDLFGTALHCAQGVSFNCVHGIVSIAFDELSEDDVFLNENNIIIDDIITSLNKPSFSSEFFDFNDNQTPEGWVFEAIRNANISNGRINAYVNDGVGRLSTERLVPFGTSELSLLFDAYIDYSYWGLIYEFKVYSGDKYLTFRTGQEDYEYPVNSNANIITFSNDDEKTVVYENTTESISGKYHLELVMDVDGYRFIGTDPNDNESFNIYISDDEYFNFFNIDKIEIDVVAHTDNNGWIDNFQINLMK